MMRKLLLSLTLLLWSSSGFAHHPFDAEYDKNKPVTLSGAATEFHWMNPHASLILNVKDPQGKTTSWTVELGSVEALTKAGWKKDSIKSGALVTVEGWQAKNGQFKANAKSVKIADGPALSAASSNS